MPRAHNGRLIVAHAEGLPQIHLLLVFSFYHCFFILFAAPWSSPRLEKCGWGRGQALSFLDAEVINPS